MKKLRWYDFIPVNIFWFGLNIRNNAISSIFMPYLVAAFAPDLIKNTALGEMRTAGLVIAMLVQPAAGLLSDRSTSRFGRRRPYIFVGVLLDLLFLAAIGLSWNYWSLLIAVLLVQFSSNISHGPLQGLIPDLIPEDQRGRASGIKTMMELLPLILLGLVGLFNNFNINISWLIFATGAILLIIMLLTMFFVKEEPLHEKPTTPFWPPMVRVLGMLAGIGTGALTGLIVGGVVGGLAGLVTLPFLHAPLAMVMGGKPTSFAVVMISVGGAVAMIVAVIAGVWSGTLLTLGRDARRHDSFTWWIVNRLMFLAAVTSIQTYALFFLKDVFQITKDDATKRSLVLVAIIVIFTIISSLIGGWLSDRLGQKQLVGWGGVIAALGGLLLLGTFWFPNMFLVYISGIIIGLGSGLFLTTNWALGTDLVPSAEAGRYLGISNLAGAGAGMIGAGIGGPMADYLNNYHPGLGYLVIFACYTVLFILSTVSLLGVRKAGE